MRAVTQRRCVEEVKRGNRIRCARFETQTLPPPPVPQIAEKAPSPEEHKLLRFLDETVRGKAALVEYGANGRYKVMSERLVADLRLYASQPLHPALCSGAGDLYAFYNETLAPLRRRMRNVAVADARIHEIARARVETAAALLAPADAAPPALVQAAPLPAPLYQHPPQGSASHGRTTLGGPVIIGKASAMLAPIAPPLPPADAIAMVRRLAKLLMPEAPAAALAGEGNVHVAMRNLHDWLASSDAAAIENAPRQAVLEAMRLVEAAAYVARIQSRYEEIDAALFGTLARMQAAHKRTCSCRE